MIDAADEKRNSKAILHFSFTTRKKEIVDIDQEAPWLKELPASLLQIYETELSMKKAGESSAVPLGALPLRDLVKTMFEKDVNKIKTFK